MTHESADAALRYSPDDFEDLVEYLDEHRSELAGRYRITGPCWGSDGKINPDWVVVTAYTHPPERPCTKPEAMPMCSYRLDLVEHAINFIGGAPAFDLETAWLELATIEEASLGRIVHGWDRS